MARFILRYDQPAAPDAHVQQILASPGVAVVDRSPNMMLVDGDPAALQATLARLPGWSLHPERSVPLPDTRHKLR
ncbi:MAG: hypothetical protein ACJ8GJ_05395 [Vitreoscilla sp.]